MTLEKIIETLNSKGSKDITVNIETKPEMLVKSRNNPLVRNPYINGLKKHQKLKCKYIFNYEEEVNKQRILEGKTPDFKAEPGIVGKVVRRDPTILETKSGNLLLQLMVIERIEVFYEYNGRNVQEQEIIQFLKQTTKSNPKQGLEHEIEIINPKLESIISIE